MVDWGLPVGATSDTIYFRLRDSTTGLAKTGLVFNSAGAVASYVTRRGLRVAITLVTLAAADSAYSSGGFKEVDATNMKGLYRLDLPDAVLAAGNWALVSIEFDGVIEETQQVGVGAFAVWEEILSGATHNVATSAGRRLRQIQENLGYEGGAVWIDTVSGTSGTENFENGTVDNPVDNIADANIIATSVGLERFKVAPGSTITFGAAQQAQEFAGTHWTLALGGRDIANTTIIGAIVTGVAVGVGTQNFIDCSIGAVTIAGDTHFEGCGISGTQTLPAGDVFYDRCHSAIAGAGAPQFDFGAAVATTDLHVRNYSGGLDIRNHGAAATDTTTIEGRGQVILNANCVGGAMAIRGNFSLTDNSATVTITDDARYNTSQDVSISAATLNSIADALLKRDWTLVTGEAARSLLNANRAIRNRVAEAGGTITVYEEDDSTPAWTAVATRDAAAENLTEVDPV